MKIDRRKFLALAGGAAALGVAGKQSYQAIAKGDIDKVVGHGENKRWAMVVDMKKFREYPEDRKRAIEACHLSHNVPDLDNKMHEIKWIWEEPFHHAFIEQENHNIPKDIHEMPVLLFCNHCNNPPCTHVCPTQATWRRESDGLVMMDWHRCIGCRYCMAACPYQSRSFNWVEPKPHVKKLTDSFPARTRGVVEKCTFCDERIARGQQPACVEACRHGGLIFGDLNEWNSPVRKVLREKYSIRRKPELGTQPEVYYIVEF